MGSPCRDRRTSGESGALPTNSRAWSWLKPRQDGNSITSVTASRSPPAIATLEVQVTVTDQEPSVADQITAALDKIDLSLRFIDADDGVAAIGEAGGAHGAHVSQSKNTDVHDAIPFRERNVVPASRM